MGKETDFYNALGALRYNYPSSVSTFGPCCTDCCNNSARGSGKCANCAEGELAKIVGDRIAMKIHNAIKLQSEWIGEAINILEND